MYCNVLMCILYFIFGIL